MIAIEVAGRQFLLADLIEPTTWSRLDPGQPKQVGKKFRQQIGKSKVAKFVGRRSGNHAGYKRV
ncbi:DUF1413 domain-containing protein [Burkholderia glumae]|uniref:DUF1413 domain-containing protein n=1 Tax=Burkholderia glumae TaxID=337 RepID=UPI00039B4DD3|nr:DUF1413 domain-containing protein [Burkholderia glumae]